MTAAQQAKIAAWREQAAALNAPAYRITFRPRQDDNAKPINYGKGKGPDDSERFYSADEVEALIPLMSRHNVRGYDVYVTPIDSENHYLVVDDMTAESHSRLTGAGYRPALVQESSADNRQAVLKAPRLEGGKSEQTAANRVVRRLNKEVGDPEFSGAVHPFRVAGFSNKKPGRSDAFTRLIEATGVICQRTVERLQKAREWVANQQAEQSRSKRAEAVRHAVPASHHGSHVTPAHEYRWRARNQPSDSDWSGIDFGVAVGMLRDGWQPAQVEQAIVEASPALSDRHRDTDGYARRTVEKAGETPDAQQRDQRATPERQTPRPGPKRDQGMNM